MIDPVYKETDTIPKGASYLRTYNTGTLDTSTMTPIVSLLKRRDGTDAGAVQMARLDPYNWALVVSRDVTSLLDPSTKYLLTIDFDRDDGVTTIRTAEIALEVSQGKPR